MKPKKKNLLVIDLLAIIAFVATFTPLIIPTSTNEPELFGLPYTMWTSFLLSVFFVVLTYCVSLLQKKDQHAD
ncbi:hypothetical protein D1013_04970 [Euzebyella marina]|uniref:DUF3311 domain-containing protein n=1 Tax=Euzebyella marina TaxID=1761453 RepID=A0A3G2LBJ2_9FLAO|nr:hypothetical protein [Euzebyella marina]AYN69614.1 hypothetical protein D1013_04970 [Euzebyella marina]